MSYALSPVDYFKKINDVYVYNLTREHDFIFYAWLFYESDRKIPIQYPLCLKKNARCRKVQVST
jgi:hypothetical protein